MTSKRSVLGLKILLWIGGLAPAVYLVVGFFQNWLTANPIERITRVTGMTTLVLLLLTLSITPLRRLTGWNPLIQLRRPFGLFAYFYAFIHFGIWAGLDMTFVWEWMVEDVVDRPYITVGFTAFVILTPLALTSTKGWIRRLGKRWGLLHRGAYVAAALGVIHYYWVLKAGRTLPVLFGVILTLSLASRVPGWRAKRARLSGSSRTAPR